MYGLQDEFDKNGKSNNMKCFGKTLWLITFLKVIYGSSSIWDKLFTESAFFGHWNLPNCPIPSWHFYKLSLRKKF